MWNVKGELFSEAERTKVAKVALKPILGGRPEAKGYLLKLFGIRTDLS